MKIVKLLLDEDSLLGGIDAVALVEHPAIEEDFMMFAKQTFEETYNDYPQKAVENAKAGIKRNEELGNPCATQVGKVRAQQLANGESVSLDTIRRMRSFLIRQKDNYELAVSRNDYDACGWISYMLWGGPEALPWAEKKLRQAGEEFEEISKEDTEKLILEGIIKESLFSQISQVDVCGCDNKKESFGKKKVVYLIACSSEKLSKEAPAKELYDSSLFKKSLHYARKKASDKDIKILSAKHYLVDLNTKLKPYDKALGDMSADQRKVWSEEVFEILDRRYDIENTQFIFLAGDDYSHYLIEMLPYCKDVLQGKRIGERLEYLDRFTAIASIDNIPVYLTIEEAEQKAKSMGCDGYHEYKDGEDVIGYMPCKSHEDAVNEGTKESVAGETMEANTSGLPNYINQLPQDKQDAILDALYNVGTSESQLSSQGYKPVSKDNYNTAIMEAFAITSNPNKGSVADFGSYKVLYQYDGPVDSKNRDFCAKMMEAKLLFRKEDINSLSVANENKEFGFYDIFKWRGSYNCRHTWKAKLYYKEDTNNKKAVAAELPGLGSAQSTKPIDNNTGKTTGLNTTVINEAFAQAELDEKQMLVGPLMVPNKLIKRIDDNGEEYYVYFDETTVEQLAYKTMEDKLNDSVNIEHNPNDIVDGVYLAESWLIKDPETDKSKLYGFNLPKGTWMGIYKVNNKQVWDEYVKTGRVKGFSVEGYFSEKLDRYANTK